MLNSSSHVVISCEGPCEEFVVETLAASGRFVFPTGNTVAVTRRRGASAIQSEFLNFAYDWPVTVLRVVDSMTEKFSLGRLYRDRFDVENVYTRPELEILTIINEGCWDDFQKRKSSEKPSEYCKRELKLRNVKSRKFLEAYWNADELEEACRRYKQLHRFEKGELCLADILR